MGGALAERATKAGFTVVGFDIDPARGRALRRLGGEPVASAADVAERCRRILFSLMTTDVVVASVRDMGKALRSGTIIVDTSTGEPEQCAALASRLSSRGVRYLDATIAGNSAETRAGTVLALVGGDRRAFLRCRDVFDCFAQRTFHLGPAGSGARMKLVFNLVLGLNRAVLAEGLCFAGALGIPPAQALEILKQGTTFSRVMDNKGGKMLARDFTPQARLSQHLKDVRLILAAGRRMGAKLPLSKLHRRLLAMLEAAGHGEMDNSAILKAFER